MAAHKILVVIGKQYKLCKRIYTKLIGINKALKWNFGYNNIHKTTNIRLNWYK